MKLADHRGYQTKANIRAHLKEDSLKKAAADMANAFKKKKDAQQVKKAETPQALGREGIRPLYPAASCSQAFVEA